jgi:hypothetical protein
MADIPSNHQMNPLQAYVDAQLDAYEFRGDGGDYTPDEQERALMLDFVNGLICDDEFLRLCAADPQCQRPADETPAGHELLRRVELLLCAPTEASVKIAHELVVQAINSPSRAMQVRNGPLDELPCDHCGRGIDEHIGLGLPCPSVKTSGKPRECSGDPNCCPENEGYGCHCSRGTRG